MNSKPVPLAGSRTVRLDEGAPNLHPHREARGDAGDGERVDEPAAKLLAAAALRPRRPIGKISAKCCSFSAVSAPMFARKYAFCSIFQNLPDSQAEIFEILQNFANFANFATFAIFLLNFHKNC